MITEADIARLNRLCGGRRLHPATGEELIITYRLPTDAERAALRREITDAFKADDQ